MKIVFMGTPRFASEILPSLENVASIVSIYTKQGSDVEASSPPGIPIKTPTSLKNFAIDVDADLGIVVAYGLMIPERIFSHFKFGCINVHPSILPRWRGAAPIERAIMAGDKRTGVTIMQLDSGLDTGDILKLQEIEIASDDTGSSLSIKLARLGSELLLATLRDIEIGVIKPLKQDAKLATYADKIKANDEQINWHSETGQEIERKIRALCPNPCAHTTINGVKLKIVQAELEQTACHEVEFGTVLDNTMRIAAAGGILKPKIVQRSGGKRMPIADFLRGFTVSPGDLAS